MKKSITLLLALTLLLGCAACAAKPYAPEGALTGNDELDAAVLSLLQERCAANASEEERLAAAYDFVCNDITYRAGTVDTSGGFTDELTHELALTLLQKRKGNCDAQAALMAVLLRRMGYAAQIVQGTFVREAGGEPVEHAWVRAEIGGTSCWFDPLYGSHYAENPRDYLMADDALLAQTHQWDASALD